MQPIDLIPLPMPLPMPPLGSPGQAPGVPQPLAGTVPWSPHRAPRGVRPREGAKSGDAREWPGGGVGPRAREGLSGALAWALAWALGGAAEVGAASGPRSWALPREPDPDQGVPLAAPQAVARARGAAGPGTRSCATACAPPPVHRRYGSPQAHHMAPWVVPTARWLRLSSFPPPCTPSSFLAQECFEHWLLLYGTDPFYCSELQRSLIRSAPWHAGQGGYSQGPASTAHIGRLLLHLPEA